MARPPKSPEDRRTDSMKIPLTESEKAAIQDAAEAAGERPVPWVRETVLRAAKRLASKPSRK